MLNNLDVISIYERSVGVYSLPILYSEAFVYVTSLPIIYMGYISVRTNANIYKNSIRQIILRVFIKKYKTKTLLRCQNANINRKLFSCSDLSLILYPKSCKKI